MQGRTCFRWLLALFFVVAGANHFRQPDFYGLMMPPWMPWPAALIALSGVAEMLGGIGILVPATRRFAGWGLIALLVAVLPANVHMTLNHLSPPGLTIPVWVLWVRLPLQGVLIAWAWWVAAARLRVDTLD